VAKYTVALTAVASATLTIETDETDPEAIVDAALSEGVPGICAQCSGWNRSHSIDLGDDWDPVLKEDGTPEIYPVDD
jgi:hypothetical protein